MRSNWLSVSFIAKTLLLIGLLSTWAAPSFGATDAPKSITIGFNPGEDSATLNENGLELAKLLQERLGVPVNIHISKDYSSLIEEMKTKKVDFAFYSAMTYVFAEKMAGAKVLLKKVYQSPYYYSTILARSNSGISKIEQLKGKKFAFVDEKSASGYLYPSVYFKKAKPPIEPAKFFGETKFSGNHEASVRMLRDGQVDAIAVFSNDKAGKDNAWTRFSSQGGKPSSVKVKSIWTSAPIPNDPFCVRQDFYDKFPKLSHDLMFALIELQEDKKDGAKFLKVLGASSLMLATSQQYEPVREMVRELDLKLQ